MINVTRIHRCEYPEAIGALFSGDTLHHHAICAH
jgi:hypothetical protein